MADVETPASLSYLDKTADLDGDATEDRVYAAGAGVTTYALLYVMRDTCGHFVGDVGSPPERRTEPSRSKGLIDLHVLDTSACESASCGCEPGENWFRFNGTSYQRDAAASKKARVKPCP